MVVQPDDADAADTNVADQEPEATARPNKRQRIYDETEVSRFHPRAGAPRARACDIDHTQEASKPVAKAKKPKKESAPPVNTAVYVTSLPLDVTVEEVHDTFKRFGIVAEEVDSGKPRIKLYTNDQGEFKGDALVVYFKPESIKLAVNMLDETDFRIGEEGPAGKMRVTEADRSYKKQQDYNTKAGEAGGKKKGPSRDQKKIMKKTQKLNRQASPLLSS